MSRGKHNSKIQTVKNKYLAQYQLWKKVYCHALKADVYFTNWGWGHLAQETKKRTDVEAEARLKLLPLAKHLIETTTTIQAKRFQDFHNYYEFNALIGGIKLVVIVIENKKQFNFLSVRRDF